MAIISFIINSEISLEFAKKIKQKNNFEIHGLAVDNSLDSKLKDSKIFNKIHKNIIYTKLNFEANLLLK